MRSLLSSLRPATVTHTSSIREHRTSRSFSRSPPAPRPSSSCQRLQALLRGLVLLGGILEPERARKGFVTDRTRPFLFFGGIMETQGALGNAIIPFLALSHARRRRRIPKFRRGARPPHGRSWAQIASSSWGSTPGGPIRTGSIVIAPRRHDAAFRAKTPSHTQHPTAKPHV